MLLDSPHRAVHALRHTFLPTDTLLLMLLLASILIRIFLLTALLGRVWCGWACPQTVVHGVPLPPDRALVRGRAAAARCSSTDRVAEPASARAGSPSTPCISSLVAVPRAHLPGVFRGRRRARGSGCTHSPVDHPTSFAIMALTTRANLRSTSPSSASRPALVACPYGRWQSVLLDRQSLIVAYDVNRGEPRAKGKKRRAATPATASTAAPASSPAPPASTSATGCRWSASTARSARTPATRSWRRSASRGASSATPRSRSLAGARRRTLRPRVVLYPGSAGALLGALRLPARHQGTGRRDGAARRGRAVHASRPTAAWRTSCA